ncbi:MAG: hypothetical protein QM740_07050 [Acidovorax sp.]
MPDPLAPVGSEAVSPSPPPAPILEPKAKFKDSLEKSVLWFALGMLVTGALGTVGFLHFVESRVKTEMQSPEVTAAIAKRATEAAAHALPKGSLLLVAGPCPAGWEDLTSTLNGRYLYIDQTATTNLQLYEEDGSHTHDGGTHSHRVTGQTAALGGGERSGNKEQRDSAHATNTPAITGTAHPENSNHSHSGGAHQHKRAGVRACKA